MSSIAHLKSIAEALWVSALQLMTMALIVIYSAQLVGTAEYPRRVYEPSCPVIEISPGMSIRGAAMSLSSLGYPLLPSEIKRAFESFAFEFGVSPSLPLPMGADVEVCLEPPSYNKIISISMV